jgi:hypothetical protein
MPTPYGDARRLVEIYRRLVEIENEEVALALEERVIAQRLYAVAPDWSGVVEPYGETGRYRLSLSTNEADVPISDVEKLSEAWQLPDAYPNPGPPPSIDLPSEEVDEDEDWDDELAGWAKMGHGIPAEASLALDDAIEATP